MSNLNELSFFANIYPAKAEFKEGDEVIVVSDPSVIYTIVSVYGGSNAICAYKDKMTRMRKELSIPLVALVKHRHIDCDCV